MGAAMQEQLRQLEQMARKYLWFNVLLVAWNVVFGLRQWVRMTPEWATWDKCFVALFVLCGAWAAWSVIWAIDLVMEIRKERKQWE